MCPPFCNYGFVMIYLPTICFATSVDLRLLVANLHKYFYNCKYCLFFLRNSFYGEFSVDLTSQMQRHNFYLWFIWWGGRCVFCVLLFFCGDCVLDVFRNCFRYL